MARNSHSACRQDLQTKFDVWLDKDRLTGGSSWSQEIEDNLDRSDVVLVLLSAGSFASEVCRGEQLRSLRQTNALYRCRPIRRRPACVSGGEQYVDFSEDATYSLRLKPWNKRSRTARERHWRRDSKPPATTPFRLCRKILFRARRSRSSAANGAKRSRATICRWSP